MTILIEGRIMRAPAVTAPAPPVFDDDLSNRIVIWQGDITTLEVEIVINITDEVTACTNPGERIPGTQSDLKEEVLNNGYAVWREDNVVQGVVSLYSRHHHHHSVTALHNCYTAALYLCCASRSVSLCALQATRAHYPPDLAAHLATRTVRRFVEQHKYPQLVVLTSQVSTDTQLLSTIVAQYFPKHTVDDRRIRIIHNPHTHTDSAEDDTSLCDEEAAMLAAARLSVDTQRLLTDTRQPTPGVINSQNQQYEQLLRRARTEDLSEVSGIGCLYQSGVDRLGRPVVVFIGKWFPIGDIDLDKALLFLIKLLDPIVRGDYVIAYFHTMAASGNHPPFSWLKEVYTVLPYKYKKNLKAFYIVHPTFWTKMMTWWFTTFMAPAIKAKVHSLPGVEYLYSVMARDQLELPAFVTEYDMTINGLHYFQPDTNNT